MNATPRPKALRRLLAFTLRHRAVSASILLTLLALGIFALLWFQPWKLFVDETVNEAAPAFVAPSGSPQTGPIEVSKGVFRSLEHETTGTARILRQADGSHIVRLEDLRTSNGPDLVVLLSDTPSTESDWRAYDDGKTAYLGKLKGNIGSQNYSVPPGIDPAAFRSVVVWCRRFTVGFGTAPITVA